MIALIADIHGNYTALKEVFRCIDSMNISEVFCLGDIVGYYTQINECCEELQRRNVKTVMGNHDWYMASGSFCPRSQSVNDCLAYQRTIISSCNTQWLRSLPVMYNTGQLSLVHGGWGDPIDEYLEPSEKYFASLEGHFFASGHVHIQRVEHYGPKIYCNPGAVGQPRDEDPRAAFATFDGKEFALHRVVYNVDEVGNLMSNAGFSGYYYGCLRAGSKHLQW